MLSMAVCKHQLNGNWDIFAASTKLENHVRKQRYAQRKSETFIFLANSVITVIISRQ